MFEFQKVRKKPVEVEAFQLTEEFFGEDWEEKEAEVNDRKMTFFSFRNPGECYAEIHTLEGDMVANIGDWIIKGVNGEIYPCKDDIFRKTYDIIEDTPFEIRLEMHPHKNKPGFILGAKEALDNEEKLMI